MTIITKEILISSAVIFFFTICRNKRNYPFNVFLLNMQYIFETLINYIKHIEIDVSHVNPFDIYTYFNIDGYLEFDSESESDTNEANMKNDTCEDTGPKYEDKYLEEIRKLDKNFKFNELEEEIISIKFVELFSQEREEYLKKIEDIEERLGFIEARLTKYEGNDTNYCEFCDDYCDYCHCEDDIYLGNTKDEKIKNLLNEQTILNKNIAKLKKFLNSYEGQEELIKKSKTLAKKFVIDQRLDKLKNCFIIEKTPTGNVLMVYNNTRESFEYYSDNTIPYRYLEAVGRKYIKQFDCRPIFVDMEEELKLAEEKWENQRIEKENREKEEKLMAEQLKSNNQSRENKKNVFAKFKSYNKEAGTGRVNTGAPPKNSIPNKNLTKEQENEKILLKEMANRYTYEGKFANFSFIKKIDRKVVDKKFAMTFADFKRMSQDKK